MVALMDDIMIAESALVQLSDALAYADPYAIKYLCRLPRGTALVRTADLVQVIKSLSDYDTMRLMRHTVQVWGGDDEPSHGSWRPASHHIDTAGDARYILARYSTANGPITINLACDQISSSQSKSIAVDQSIAI